MLRRLAALMCRALDTRRAFLAHIFSLAPATQSLSVDTHINPDWLRCVSDQV